MFYSKLLLQRSAIDTRCIDSNLESGRYISRVGRASSFLSLCRGTAVPAMIWPRILVFTSMMLRVLTPAAFGSYGAGIYIPKLGLVPKHVRPVRPVANLYDLLTS